MKRYDPTAEVSDLPTFDAEEFRTMCAVSRFLPANEKAVELHLLAVHNVEEAEGLLDLALDYVKQRSATGNEMAQKLQEGMKIRLAAAAHCRRLSAGWAAEHARNSF